MSSKLYPTNVTINEAGIAKFTRILKTAYVDITREISTATDFGANNRRAILSQIESILLETGVNVDEFVSADLPGYYKVGADYAVKQLKNVGAEIPYSIGFNQVHQEAVQFLIDDTKRAMFEALSGVKRSADLLLNKATRDLITQKIATGIISGNDLATVRQTIKGILQESGLDALTDKGGRGWSLDTYSEMLYRTKVVETRNHGFANRMVENGYDLVQVSSHSGSCPQCEPWQGVVLSVTGNTDGYPTLAEAEAEGLFHPNCRHAINALIPSLASKTSAYDSGE